MNRKFKLIIILSTTTLLCVAMVFFYFTIWNNAKIVFNNAIRNNDIKNAEKLIIEGKFDNDSLAKNYALAILSFKKNQDNLLAGFNFLLRAISHNPYIHFSLSNQEIERIFLNYLNTASQSQKMQFALDIKLKNAPPLWQDFFWNYFHQEAISKQTVQSWSNCLHVSNTIEQSEMAIHERRSIFLDYDKFHSVNDDAIEIIKKNPCYAPILSKIDRVHNKNYKYEDLFNASFERNNFLSWRYIVADFNTTDENGLCKGCEDKQVNNIELDEFNEILTYWHQNNISPTNEQSITEWFSSLNDNETKKWENHFYTYLNYLHHVEQSRTTPLVKEPRIEIAGKIYCIGQRMCLCEIKNDTIVMTAQFVTSSKNAATSQANQLDYDGQPRYYGPKCKITSRYWDHQFAYDSLDQKRDKQLGGGSRNVMTYKGEVPLPNFMTITPDDEFPGAKGYFNGIHEFAVGGNLPGFYMGTPISLGCVRLHDYPSKFVRWWTPNNANFFTLYDNSHYIQLIPGISSAKFDSIIK